MECEPDELRINVGNAYYNHYEENNIAFDTSLVQDEIIEVGKAPLKGNDLKVVQYLRAMMHEPTLTDEQEDVINRIRQAYENGDIPQNITKNIIKEVKSVKDLGSMYFVITNMIPDQYLYHRRDAVLHTEGEKQVILSCYLKENQHA